jgi:hydrogenase/urease accessory protein HupE
MQIRHLIRALAGSLLIFTSPLWAHTSESTMGLIGVLLHPFTGIGHLLLLFLTVICIVCVKRWQQKNM